MPNDLDRQNALLARGNRKTDELRQNSALQRRVAGEDVPDSRALTGAMIGQQEPQTIEKIVIPENAIVRRDDGAMVYKRFVITAKGLEIPDGLAPDEWQDVGYVIKGLDSSIAWAIGDWAIAAMELWGLTASQIAKMFEYETTTIESYISVCRSVRGLIRNQASTFGHARLVATLDEDQQQAWLFAASQSNWTVARMREAMHPKSNETPVPEAKQAAKYGGAINKALPNLHALDDKRKRQVAEQADWLAQYYADIARRARGE